MMQWTPQQDAALVAVRDWLNDPSSQVFRLFGYAGTGKTTMAKHLAADVRGTTLFAAYTGKAAHVLQQRGCTGARTIHSLIYTSKDRAATRLKELEAELLALGAQMRMAAPAGLGDEALGKWINDQPRILDLRRRIEEEHRNAARPSFSLNQESDVKNAKLVVIDECSMVDATMGADLLSFGTKVLVLGDPAQLPPVMGGGYFTEAKPDIMLTDIQRQARDNPIIAMATRVRNHENLRLGDYGGSSVVERVGSERALEVDQLLVGRNRTRHACNTRNRELLGRSNPLPEPGDRMVCLRNNSELGLLNGALWDCVSAEKVESTRLLLRVAAVDGNQELECEAHTHGFLGVEDKLPFWERKEAQEFAYGYALTVHKAQGSQWNDVILFDEAGAFGENRWRWLYTGLTRAAERVTVVRL